MELPPEPEQVHRAPPTGPACTGKESAARKYQLLEAIERTTTPTSLKQLLEDNRQEMDWLWRAANKNTKRAELASKAKLRARQLQQAAQVAPAAQAAPAARQPPDHGRA